ncbi:phage/plasmid primase, P4 family [Nostoc sp.]|uniref:phage/plasmid primase, P4 family n=1 Tax=Nostoc sp. TaxID=1180 RepID=UPI002FF909AB
MQLFPIQDNPFAYNGGLVKTTESKNDNTVKTMNHLTITNYSGLPEIYQENIGIPLPVVPYRDDILNNKGKPIFTGKVPSYYKNSKPTLIKHSEVNSFDDVKEYFNTDEELSYGTKIIDDKIFVIDIDCKSEKTIINDVLCKIREYNLDLLDKGLLEKTPSGGYHLYVKVKNPTDITIFTVKGFEQYKIGEIISKNHWAFIVHAPSKGYELINNNTPVEIDSLGSIGVIPYKASNKIINQLSTDIDKSQRKLSSYYRGRYKYLKDTGEAKTTDRSYEFTGLAKDLYSLRNRHKRLKDLDNFIDDIDEVIRDMGVNLFDDESRVDRILKSIDENVCFDSENKLSDTELVELLLPEVENKLKYSEQDDCWYVYDDTNKYWKKCPNNARVINSISECLQQLNIGKVNYYHVQNCERLLKGKLITEFHIDFNLLPLADCVLNISTNQLIEHSPELMLTYNVGYSYSNNPECPITQKWLLESLGGIQEQVEVLRAYLNCIVTGKIELQRFIHLLGSGGSGKSTFTKLATALVGEYVTHTTKLQKLEENRFETAALKNKKLCLINDSDSYGGEISILKNMTGNDSVPYELKGKQQGESRLTPSCMVVITSNEPLRLKEYTSGLARRRITIRFENKPNVSRNLIDKAQNAWQGELVKELPQVLNWVLSMPNEQVVKLIKYTEQNVLSLVQTQRNTLIDTNPLAAWVDYNVVYETNAKSYCGNQTLDANKYLYSSYYNYCENSGFNAVSINKFSDLLLDLLQSQLKQSSVTKRRDSTGIHFTCIRIRTSKDSNIPTPVTGISLRENIELCPSFLLTEDESSLFNP